jgi:hypothetical protein
MSRKHNFFTDELDISLEARNRTRTQEEKDCFVKKVRKMQRETKEMFNRTANVKLSMNNGQ